MLLLLVSLATVGCAPAIGDECETALDCSQSGTRICDRTQPAGYCTIDGCERGTCPEDSVCVKFRPGKERLAVTYCMATCEDNGDCRDDEGYRCTSTAEFGASEAEILGRANQQFCSIPPLMSLPFDDAGTPDAATPEDASTPDAAAPDASDEDAGR